MATRRGRRAASARPTAAPAGTERPKITSVRMQEMKDAGQPIVAVTAYDTPFAHWADAAGVDLLLVGDSLGMVVLGYESTLPVTLDDVIRHAQAVVRAKPRALVVADMPFLSFQVSPRAALRNAGRLVQEAGVEAVKLEGGERVLPMVEAILRADIPVLGHVGLTPQSIHRFGGYRVQGRERASRARIRRDARLLEAAGCFAIVLEAIPVDLAGEIRSALRIPTIGIGAGPDCDGQVLVLHDLLGLGPLPPPRFVRPFAALGPAARDAIAAYARAVREREFPSAEHSYGSTRRWK